MKPSNIRTEYRKIPGEMKKLYETCQAEAYGRAMKNWQPVLQPEPKLGKTWDGDAAYKLHSGLADINKRIDGMVKEMNEEVLSIKSKAPSDEAMNFLTMLKAKRKPTAEDTMGGIEKYGQNYMVFNALLEVSKEHELGIKAIHPLDTFSDAFDASTNLLKEVGTVEHMRQGMLSDRMTDLINTGIDAIPDLPDAGE